MLRNTNGGTVSKAPPAGSPAIAPRWLQVDGAAQYMGDVSRKTVYAAVAAGMRVARLSDAEPRRDSRGRRCHGRMFFYTLWIDEFLLARATGQPPGEPEAGHGKSLTDQHEVSQPPAQIATPLQRTTKSAAVSSEGQAKCAP